MNVKVTREETHEIKGQRFVLEVTTSDSCVARINLQHNRGSLRLWGLTDLIEVIDALTTARDIILKPALPLRQIKASDYLPGSLTPGHPDYMPGGAGDPA